jgi:hypothetical protein
MGSSGVPVAVSCAPVAGPGHSTSGDAVLIQPFDVVSASYCSGRTDFPGRWVDMFRRLPGDIGRWSRYVHPYVLVPLVLTRWRTPPASSLVTARFESSPASVPLIQVAPSFHPRLPSILSLLPSSGAPDCPRHLLLALMASWPGTSAPHVRRRRRSIRWSL